MLAQWILRMIDSHCHLDDARFADDVQSILKHATARGIEKFIIPGVRSEQWPLQQHLEATYSTIHNAFGIHPWFCHQHNDSHLYQLEALLPHAIAVGECGLDFSIQQPDMDTQRYFFQKQLALADTFKLPVIVHCVQSTEHVAMQLRSYPQLRGVIHGFAGSLQQAETFINMGFSIGIGTRLLQRPGKKAKALLHKLPLTSILLESDAPDGLKYQRNEPANLIDIAQTLATLRQISLECVQSQCTRNTKELFSL